MSSGLDPAEAEARLREQGPNEIQHERPPSIARQLLGQLRGPMVWLLAGAAVVSAALGEAADAIAIAAILLINTLLGFMQEHRAERAMAALRGLTAPRARVRRGGRIMSIPSSEIVAGDLLVLDAGDVVPADARLLEASALRTNEAALTGESLPVEKSTSPSAVDAPLAERFDHVFMGTAVAAGSGFAEVVATGMRTELGRIARLLTTARRQDTPLERRLARVGRTLLALCVAIVAAVAVIGVVRGDDWFVVMLTSVSLAVAAVPEGLTAMVTIALAVGVQRMASRNALVRRLPAVETLGATTVICTDKTGTLTTGKMRVREIWGDPRAVLDAAAACSDAELDATEQDGTGDTTEIAILVAAAERGIRRDAIETERPRESVLPFDSERKRMSIRRADGRLYVKGATDLLLPLSTSGTEGVAEAARDMAARGLRVLGVATGAGETEENLELVGLLGMADPPRTEAIEAIDQARRAGVKTVMITGDHPLTAQAIARELGLLRRGDDPDEVVHARVTPEDKLRIVRSWKERGAIVAMTGDGVNDAPALREADIGIAMGKTGTDVAREAASIVLTDDNYASIVAAIREGRGIFANIRKTLAYLLEGNACELLVMLGAAIAGLPLPLLPLQILWINLFTDGLPALALVVDPVERDVLERKPRPPSEPILARRQWGWIVGMGLLEAGVVLGVFVWALEARDLVEARNLAFSVLVFSEVLRAFAARSETLTLFEVGALGNLKLVGVVALTVLVQLALHHIPFTQALFQIGTISLADCALSLAIGFIPVSVREVLKLAMRLRRAPTVSAEAHA